MSDLRVGQITDIGRIRKANQDSLAVLGSAELGGRADGLYIVADGMGGRAGGEVASQVAVAAVRDVVCDRLGDADGLATPQEMSEILREALRAANAAVWRRATSEPHLRGMGTTCIAVLVARGAAAVGNVGDSRVYRLREGALTQLTSDHSLVQEYVDAGDISAEEARASRFRNVITRAIGADPTVEPDVDLIEVRDGDTVLLCTDGLTTMVSDRQIARILAGTLDAQETCRNLVDAANARGGADNITVVVVRSGQFAPISLPVDMTDAADENGYTEADLYDDRRAGRGSGAALALILMLVVLVGGTIYFVARGLLIPPSQPLLPQPGTHRETQQGTQQKPIDLATAQYGKPVPVTSKPVRAAPMVCDSKGNVYAASLSGKILRIPRDGGPPRDLGTPDHALPAQPPSDSQHWAADSQGYLYMADPRARSIYKLSPSNTRVAVIGSEELRSPQSVAVDEDGNIYVVDGQTLLVFHPKPQTADTSGAPAAQH